MTKLDEFNKQANVFHYLCPINPKRVKNQTHFEVTGKCPINEHCTKSQYPLTVRADGSAFYCRKFKRGGRALDALGLKRGILSCEEIGSKHTSEQWKMLLQAVDEELEDN